MIRWRSALPACLALSLACAAPSFAQQTPAPTASSAVVAAAGGWTRTGVSVRRGAQLQVNAQGQWSTERTIAPFGPAGTRERQPGALAPAFNVGALIGKIGDGGQPFVVGAGFSGAAAADGELLLAFNDDPAAAKDNIGRVAVSIAVRPPLQVSQLPATTTLTRPPAILTPPPTVATRPPTIAVAPTAPVTRPSVDTTAPTRPPSAQPPQTTRPPTASPPQTTRPPPPVEPPANPDAPPPKPEPSRPSATVPPQTAEPPATEEPGRDTAALPTPEPANPPEPAEPARPPEPEALGPPADAPPDVPAAPVETAQPSPPAAPATPVRWPWLLPAILAAAVLLGLLTLALRGRRPAAPDQAAAGLPRVTARVQADGRDGQALTVSWRGRA